jgi:hypothetical protein
MEAQECGINKIIRKTALLLCKKGKSHGWFFQMSSLEIVMEAIIRG